MKKELSMIFWLSMTMAACQNLESEKALLEKVHSDFPEQTSVEHDIAVNILTSRFDGYRNGERHTRALEEFTLTPYVVDGDTLLYVAQYDDGWEIYSACHATNMILFSSEEGDFDINDPSMPEQLRFLISQNAEVIGKISEIETDYIDPSWGAIALSEETLANGDITASGDNNERVAIKAADLPPGRWVLLECEEIESNTYTSPKLIKTKWGQEPPWNTYAKSRHDPNDNGKIKQCVAGCAPVAISQYMYYTHYKDGIPEKSASSVISISNAQGDVIDYKFIIPDTKVWDKMAWFYYQIGTNASAILIGNTGRQLKSTYGLNSTSTEENNYLTYLTQIYNCNFERKYVNFTEIKNLYLRKNIQC